MPKIVSDLTKKKKSGLLVATSGDTGSAALDGFGRDASLPAVVLYPANGVSSVQRLQMHNAPGNVCVLPVQADFDFCQNFVKKALSSKQTFGINWMSANSVNWGRFAPQARRTKTSFFSH